MNNMVLAYAYENILKSEDEKPLAATKIGWYSLFIINKKK